MTTTALPTSFAPATTIDEVITQLDEIIARAMLERSRLGFFAVLYRTVTAAVKEGIAAGRFENGPRMERLDVVFANRYLEAYHVHRCGGIPMQSWQAAFAAGTSRRAVILQHLLLGMNAHINLDLAIAAADVCPGASIAGLEHDFNEINAVLAYLETGVQEEVCKLSPWIDRLNRIDPRVGRVVANFSIDKARACSWAVAQRLAYLEGPERDATITAIDAEIAMLARLIERPVGVVINMNLVLVRLRETWDPCKVMRGLGGK